MTIKSLSVFLLFSLGFSPLYSHALDYRQGLEAFRKQDYKQALSVWQDLASNNDAKSEFNVGVMFANGLGVDKDEKKAFDWIKKSADQGYAQALFNLGHMYEHGTGVETNMQNAVRAYSQAAEQGDARAQTNLGRLTYLGKGTARNPVIAYALFYAAGTQGVKSALFNQQHVYSELNPDEQKQAEELSEEFYQRFVVKTHWY